ncbi:uncharacterized protein [Epargyreus clarus]|uniref:uncharacterized protein isoform X2 n=1 Tax=Epargyreus clarus TaxID=520877 RepID=UPI003C2F5EBC
MWKKLPYSTPYFLFFTEDNGYYIYITDFINIWWVKYTKNEFLSVLKKSNDDLEMENEDELLQIGLKMLRYPEDLKKLQLIFEDKKLAVSMTLSHGFPIYLDIQLLEGSKEMFYQKVTHELINTVHDLRLSENELRSLLIKKDKEIEEYKGETDARLAMYLKTAFFHDEEHMSKHPMYSNVFGTLAIPDCLLQRTLDDTEDKVVVKQEEKQTVDRKVKVETDSQLVKNEPESQVPDIQQQIMIKQETVKRKVKIEPLNKLMMTKELRLR